MDDIGSRIKNRREELGYTQEFVASKLGVSRVAVTKWESGATANLKLENLMNLCKLFNFSVEYLIHGKKKGSSDFSEIEDILGKDFKSINMQRAELLKEAMEIPEADVTRAKKIIKTFNEPDSDGEEQGSGG
jgi:transcriptional regulator with XRE-family HTH domain